jgi:hypothetical protein
MQYVNDDMDELYRRAAEGYPLNTGGADWNKIQTALKDPHSGGEEKKSNNRKFLWLFLLLPLGLVCNRYFIYNEGDVANLTASAPHITKAGTGVKKVNTFSATKNSAATIDAVVTDSAFQTRSEKLTAASVTRMQVAENKVTQLSANTAFDLNNQSAAAIGQEDDRQFTKYIDKGFPQFGLSLDPLKASAKTSLQFDEPVDQPKPVEKNRKRFYAGLIGGVDATTIKLQKFEDAGYDYGILFGYALNKKWSLETGIYHDKKFYYSKGEYFNTAKLYMPPNSEITEVKGNCKMFEIPVSLRYNFPARKKASFFTTAGVSSYFMTLQNYDYTYLYRTTGQQAVYSKSYPNSSSYFFSIVQVSGGYSHRVGKIGDLRIEPYLKIPLRGVGTGQLPLTSAGLHIGITKNLF